MKQSIWIRINRKFWQQYCFQTKYVGQHVLYLPQAAYRGRSHMCSNVFGIEWRCVSHSEILQEVRSSVPRQVEEEHCWKNHGSPEIIKNKQNNQKFSMITNLRSSPMELISSNSFSVLGMSWVLAITSVFLL